MYPPTDVRDVAGWDRFWEDQVSHGIAPLHDLFTDDRRLVAALQARGKRSVLCAGNGISMEPHALAAAGFEVAALDLSAFALEFVKGCKPSRSDLAQFLDKKQSRSGGIMTFVVGDIMDAETCRGPYDLIIERRTAQNFSEGERPAFLAALADRLEPQGIFFSHCHDATWKPPDAPEHHTEAWFRERGWVTWRGEESTCPVGRVAWLSSSTG